MSDSNTSKVSLLLQYLAYGVIASAVVLIPWFAVEELLDRMPVAGAAKGLLSRVDLPPVAAWLLMLGSVVVALILIGWLTRRFVWDRLVRTPLFRTFLPQIETLTEQLGDIGIRRRDAVVFVAWPNEDMRTIGVVTGQIDESGAVDAWLTVVLFPIVGQLKGGMLRLVDPAKVTYPGWTLEQAFAFVTSLGAASRPMDSPPPSA